MGDKPILYDFTKWLSDKYETNGSTARAGAIGEYYFKCDGTREYVFRWDGSEWKEVGIVQFGSKYEARSAHRDLCDSTNNEVGWKPENFVEKHT